MVGELGALDGIELVEGDHADAVLRQRGAQFAFKARRQPLSQLEHALLDSRRRFRGGQSVLSGALHSRVDLIVEPGHPHHVELVEIGRIDRAELDALEQRDLGILRELKHPLVEVEPGELPVDVQSGVLERRRVELRLCERSRHLAERGLTHVNVLGGHRRSRQR